MNRNLGIVASLGIVAALYAAFIFAPTDATVGDVQRISYFHVPSAWSAFLAFGVGFVASVQWLRTRQPRWDTMAVSSADVGIIFCTIALVTGSIWAKPIWGTLWDWNLRLTATLNVWLIYVSYLMLRSSVENPARRASLAAVVGIVGFIDVLVVFMSIRWWRSIHPVMLKGTGLGVAPPMLAALVAGLVAFTLLYV